MIADNNQRPNEGGDGITRKDPLDPTLSSPNTVIRTDATDDFTRVEVEKMDERPEIHATGDIYALRMNVPNPPVWSTWICLLAAWLFLGSSIPFTVFIGLPLNLVALVLGAISLARGGIFTGISVFLLGTIGSLIVYVVGVFKFLGSM